MNFILGLILGALAGVVLERAVGQPLDHVVVGPLRRAWRRRAFARAAREVSLIDECTIVAGSSLFVHQFVPGGIAPENLVARMDPKALDLSLALTRSDWSAHLPDAATLRTAESTWAKELSSPDTHLWNGTSLALTRIDVSRDPDNEDPVIHLLLREQEYATARAVEDAWTAVDLQTRRRADGNSLRRVDPILSHGFGLNCTVETADGLVLLTQRSDLALGWERHTHISFNEGLSRADRKPGGVIDVIGAFARGMWEELGIDALQIPNFVERLTIHTLMLDVDRYQWGLLAHLDLAGTAMTSTEFRARRNLGTAPDDWEAAGLRFIPFSHSPDAALNELRNSSNWVSHGLLNLALSTIHRYPDTASDVRSALSSM